jgi:hypothetical protein
MALSDSQLPSYTMTFIYSGVRHLQEIVDAGLEVPSVNQIELHPFCQQKEIVKWCQDHGVVVQVCPHST